MQFDFTNLTAGQMAMLGVLATLISAAAAASASLAGTLLKGRIDAKSAAVAAQRAYLLSQFQPGIDYAKRRARSAIALRAVFERFSEKAEKGDELRKEIEDFMEGGLGMDTLLTMLAVSQRRAYLFTSIMLAHRLEVDFVLSLRAHLDGKTTMTTEQVRDYANGIVQASGSLHESVQRLVFRDELLLRIHPGEYSWPKRFLYRWRTKESPTQAALSKLLERPNPQAETPRES